MPGGCEGGVNARTGRTGNTCKAVSVPPPTQLQTARIHHTFFVWMLFFFHASQRISGRQSLAALPSRCGESSGTGVPDQPPPRSLGGWKPHLLAARRGAGGVAHRLNQPVWAGGGEKRTGRGEKIIAYLMRCWAKEGFSRGGTGGGVGGGASVVPHTHPRPPTHTQEPPCAGVVIIFVNFLSTVC